MKESTLKTLMLIWTFLSVLLQIGLLAYIIVNLENVTEEARTVSVTKTVDVRGPAAMFNAYMKDNAMGLQKDEIVPAFEFFQSYLKEFKKSMPPVSVMFQEAVKKQDQDNKYERKHAVTYLTEEDVKFINNDGIIISDDYMNIHFYKYT